jgi:hypothetical protein
MRCQCWHPSFKITGNKQPNNLQFNSILLLHLNSTQFYYYTSILLHLILSATVDCAVAACMASSAPPSPPGIVNFASRVAGSGVATGAKMREDTGVAPQCNSLTSRSHRFWLHLWLLAWPPPPSARPEHRHHRRHLVGRRLGEGAVGRLQQAWLHRWRAMAAAMESAQRERWLQRWSGVRRLGSSCDGALHQRNYYSRAGSSGRCGGSRCDGDGCSRECGTRHDGAPIDSWQ